MANGFERYAKKKRRSEFLEEMELVVQDLTSKRFRYKDRIDEEERERKRTKSQMRSKVEHVFQSMKLQFGFVKVRYRELGKNANRLLPPALWSTPCRPLDTAAPDAGRIT